jgi:hypothetical protein
MRMGLDQNKFYRKPRIGQLQVIDGRMVITGYPLTDRHYYSYVNGSIYMLSAPWFTPLYRVY